MKKTKTLLKYVVLQFPKTEKWHETLNNINVHHNMYIYIYISINEINK